MPEKKIVRIAFGKGQLEISEIIGTSSPRFSDDKRMPLGPRMLSILRRCLLWWEGGFPRSSKGWGWGWDFSASMAMGQIS